MVVLDSTVVNVSLPYIAGDLSATIDEATWTLTAYLAANAVILPMTGWLGSLFGRKRLLLLSTPNGKQGVFWRYWSEGGADWGRVEVRAEDVPRISRRFLEEERRSMPAAWYRQEYECSFEQAEDAVFRAEDIRAAFNGDIPTLFGGPPA